MTAKTGKTPSGGLCRRCGTCCRKGGPALHLEDQGLVEQGKIALKDLFTIRQGEPAYDNVAGAVSPAETDIIKVRGGSGGDPGCCFYDRDLPGCAIYVHRPLECRVLQCWDTRGLTRTYGCDRLTRRHLLTGVPALWDLVADHQDRCSYERIAALARSMRGRKGPACSQSVLMEMLRYDQSLREVAMENCGPDDGLLAFLFGRPLVETIGFFRLCLVRKEHGYAVEPG